MTRRHVLLASVVALAPFLGCGSETTEDTVSAPVNPEDIQDYPDDEEPPPKSAKPR